MNEMTTEGINQQVTARGADDEDFSIIVENETLDGRDVFRLDGGEIGQNLDGPVVIRIGSTVS